MTLNWLDDKHGSVIRYNMGKFRWCWMKPGHTLEDAVKHAYAAGYFAAMKESSVGAVDNHR